MQILNEIQRKLPSIIYFDEKHFLRERTSDFSTVLNLIEELKHIRTKVENDSMFQLVSMLGYLYRIAGNEEKEQLTYAIQCFEECLAYSQTVDDKKKVAITYVRLGEAFKYQDNHEKALILFQIAERICLDEGLEQQLDFVYQHKGKCFMEMHDFKGAEEHLQQALGLRKKKSDATLIDSTIKALQLIQKLKSE